MPQFSPFGACHEHYCQWTETEVYCNLKPPSSVYLLLIHVLIPQVQWFYRGIPCGLSDVIGVGMHVYGIREWCSEGQEQFSGPAHLMGHAVGYIVL